MGITVFTPAPMPPNEAIRSEAALQSGLPNRVNDPVLVEIANDVKRALNSRWSGIAVVANEIQHIVASSDGLTGLYQRSTMLGSYVIYRPKRPFIVLDALKDERFAGNPHVDDGTVIFYAGAAIFDVAGHAVGVLCISDCMPRFSFSLEEEALLMLYAESVSAILR